MMCRRSAMLPSSGGAEGLTDGRNRAPPGDRGGGGGGAGGRVRRTSRRARAAGRAPGSEGGGRAARGPEADGGRAAGGVRRGGPLGVLKQMAEELQEEFGGEGDGPGAGATPLELLREGLRKELADGQAALEAACEGDTCDAPNVRAATPPRRPARLTEEQ